MDETSIFYWLGPAFICLLFVLFIVRSVVATFWPGSSIVTWIDHAGEVFGITGRSGRGGGSGGDCGDGGGDGGGD